MEKTSHAKSAVSIQLRNRPKLFMCTTSETDCSARQSRLRLATGLADAVPKHREDGVSDRDVEIFDDLHVLRWDDHTQVTKQFHLSTLKSSKPDRPRTGVTRNLKTVEHVRRLAAAADREDDVVFLHERLQLLRKNVIIALIVRPSCHQWYVVC